MNEQLIVLLEAVRLARLELDCFQDPLCRASDTWTINRLSELLHSHEVSRSMALLVPGTEDTPSIVPNSDAANLYVHQYEGE
jgi:hypothetical protein